MTALDCPTQPLLVPSDNPRMRGNELDFGVGVLELAGLQLFIWWGSGDGEPSRAAWRCRRTGELLAWAVVGEA